MRRIEVIVGTPATGRYTFRLRLAGLIATALVTTGCTTWSQFRGSPARTGFQPIESAIDASNVSDLALRWQANLGSNFEDSGSQRLSPVVANGIVYVGKYESLLAFDAGGTKGCSGSPTTCAPLWTYRTDGPVLTSPSAIANGVIYLGSAGTLYAFDAAGTTGCAGVPKRCAPLWTASGRFEYSSATIVNGVVYLGTFDGLLEAFDADGQAGCSGMPRTCAPLWTATAGTRIDASPTVANGLVYVASTDGKVSAFDATGRAGCSGLPKVCTPRWTAATGSIIATPAVADGVVYVDARDQHLYAFDAAGGTGCSGSPKTCAPLWTADIGAVSSASPAVAHGVVYVNGPSTLFAFDGAGKQGCGGVPKTCHPLWTTTAANTGYANFQSPTVANGLVYADGAMNDLAAFDAKGSRNCTGPPPKTCAPLWVGPHTGDGITSEAAVVNGVVYVVYFQSNQYLLRAYTRA